MQQKDILNTDNVFFLLLKLSIPTMIGGFFSALYNIIDSMFVGYFVGLDALAALTISHSVQLIFISFSVLFGVGSGVLISRFLGEKNDTQVNSVIVTTSCFVFTVTLFTSIIFTIFLRDILSVWKISEAVLHEAINYMEIIILFSFMVLLNGVFSGMLRAKGYSRLAMNLSVLGAVLNIILDAIFIIIFSWGVFGAALATVISQGVVFVCSLMYIHVVYQINPFDIRYLDKNIHVLWQIITTGFPSGSRLLMIALSTVVTNKVLSSYGMDAIAIYGIVSRVISMAFMPIQGCNFGVQPIVSYNLGAKNWKRIHNTLCYSLLMIGVIGGIGTLLFQYAPTLLFEIFTKDQQVIILAKDALAKTGSLFVFFGIYMLLAGFVQSVGYVKEALFLSLLRPVLTIILLFILPRFWGLDGVWYITPLIDTINMLLAIIISKKVYEKIKNDLVKTETTVTIEGEFYA